MKMARRNLVADANRGHAFTLTEVMFAVIILGIGFILIAGMFPVMISQSKTTVEETAAASIARGAMAISSRVSDGGDTSIKVGTVSYPLMPVTNLLTVTPTGMATPEASTAAKQDIDQTPVAVPAGQQFFSAGKVLAFDDQRIATGGSPDYRTNLWNSIRGNLVLPSDNRFAWVPLYRRDCTYYNATSSSITLTSSNLGSLTRVDAPFATVYFVPVSVRNRASYDASNLTSNNDVAISPANLSPRPIGVQIVAESSSVSGYVMVCSNAPDKAAATTKKGPYASGAAPTAVDSVAEGCFLIISDDRDLGALNGRVYRVGSRRADLDSNYTNLPVWEVAPGSGTPADEGVTSIPTAAAGANTVAIGMIVGRNLNGATVYEGPTQDVSVYVTFVKCN